MKKLLQYHESAATTGSDSLIGPKLVANPDTKKKRLKSLPLQILGIGVRYGSGTIESPEALEIFF